MDAHAVAGLKLSAGELIEANHSVKLLWPGLRGSLRSGRYRRATEATESLAVAISQAWPMNHGSSRAAPTSG
jgi:hypothetical protein